MTLVDFLLARIAEDETAAGVPDPDDGESWRVVGGYGWPSISPARMRAECEAKRQIVGEHPLVMPDDWTEANPPACGTCRPLLTPYPCDTLRLLALPYADHPEYDITWGVSVDAVG